MKIGIYITGKAGCGKTQTLIAIKELLKERFKGYDLEWEEYNQGQVVGNDFKEVLKLKVGGKSTSKLI